MKLLLRSIILYIFFTGFLQLSEARNLDSLRIIWKNKSLPDTIRLKAIEVLAWEGYGYSQPDSAFFYAQQLFDFAEEIGNKKWMAKALKLQGNSCVVRSEYVKAFGLFTRSLGLSEEINDLEGIAGTLHSLGIIYYYQGDRTRALEYYLKSLKLREEINDKKGISGSLNNIGIVYSQQGHYENAIEYFTRSLNLAKELNDERGVASALNNLGLIHKETGDYRKASEHYLLSLQITEKLGDSRDVAATYNNIAQIYALQGLLHKAIESFERSIEIKETIGDRNGIAVSLNAIGNVMEIKHDYHSAIKWCLKGLSLAEEVGAINEQKGACECLYHSYKAINNSERALFYHERLALLNDSLSAAEISKAIQQLEFSKQILADSILRAGEQQSIKEAHALEVRKKNQSRNIFIAATVFLLIGAVSLYNRIRYIRKSRAEIAMEKTRSDNLLLNILPANIARELKENGRAIARNFENITILFTDFKDFTSHSTKLSPEELVAELNTCFVAFDSICEKYGVEKIKTVGDAYMVAGGLPVPTPGCVKSTVMAALEMMQFMMNRKIERDKRGESSFEMRAGIHTGSVVAGIVGVKKFQYDVWGDTVNLASRMEQNGEVNKVNISKETYDKIKGDPAFNFEYRGTLDVKGKGCTEMYFVYLQNQT